MVEFLRRYKTVLLLVVIAAAYYPRFAHQPDGMTLYPLGAAALLHGQVLEAAAPGFAYPPLFALMAIPFVPMPMWLRNVVWYAVLVGATWLSYRLCERLTVGSFPELSQGRRLVWLRVLAVVLSLKFVLAVLENQAYDVIVFLCVLGGLWGMQAGRNMRAAAGFALAAALKATPLLFLPYLLLRRRVKLFLLCVVFYAGFSFLPDVFFTPQGAPHGYFVTWVRDLAMGSVRNKPVEAQTRHWEQANLLNQSLRGMVYEFAHETSGAMSRRNVLVAVYLGFGLIVFVLLLRSARTPHALLLDGSLVLISMLMLSPQSSKSGFIALMLPYMALSACVLAEPRGRWIGGGVLAASFALTTLTSKGVIGKRLAEICLTSGCVTLGTLVLLVFIGYLVLRHARRDQAVP
ncbi:MAG: glycosyltransferase 87 family protein [Verrucomicrobia bacterium]|nr:glycosyltransferase 87 family protein [Verrucomicrobiota bacterium]